MDLLHILPDFPIQPFSHLLPSLDKNLVTTSDILTLDSVDVARHAQLPVSEVRELANALLEALHDQLDGRIDGCFNTLGKEDETTLCNTTTKFNRTWNVISTLDDGLDLALGGGFPTGYLVEITGESGAGKTQLLLTLLLSTQLPPPHGVSRSAIYISTEAPLATNRLHQLLNSHPILSQLPAKERPSLSRILSIQTPDLEAQDHILRYQLPVAIRRHDIGLIILDSVAANFRAEYERRVSQAGAVVMAKRSRDLVQLGKLLRDLARSSNIAVVVANQVADRFGFVSHGSLNAASLESVQKPFDNIERHDALSYHLSTSGDPRLHHISPSASSSMIPVPPLFLDHQQRWFTGWGDASRSSDTQPRNLKTPSLGLAWANQLAARVALVKEAVYGEVGNCKHGNNWNRGIHGDDSKDEEGIRFPRWRRWFKVVFASWTSSSECLGVEFEVLASGVRACIES